MGKKESQRFSIRKFNFGVASVLLCFWEQPFL
ncbi:YSIRK-type signal peptide-containing protein [Streptococcus salivarius]|nr:YSIRK-type signal peptide-containing protein [Streptococcus salivarius]MDB8592039.1 YSIRK-type signal peptide-containing protein [Streptococcus salivarius]